MSTITEYRVASAKSLDDLEQSIKIMLASGWQPHGSLIWSGSLWVQAMVHDTAPDLRGTTRNA
jgi:hypothetical protein